jgi:DNA repair exonuclease SbcCD nuclease subunit
LAKYAILNDTHFGARRTSDIIIREQERFFNEVFFPYCKKHRIKGIFHAGDYWTDRYALSVKSLYASRKMFLEKIRDNGMTMEIIPGNHDLGYKNTSTLNALKESFGYFQPHVIIHSNPVECEYEDGMKLLWLPWVNTENLNRSLTAIENSSADILIGHLALSGFEFFLGQEAKAVEDEYITAEKLKKFKAVWSGHYHHKSSRDNIVYLGTQYQMTWNDYGSRKYFHVVDTKKPTKLIAVENPRTLFAHYYYDDKNNEEEILSFDPALIAEKYVKIFILNKTNPHLFETFLQRINSSSGAHEIRVMPIQAEHATTSNETNNIGSVPQKNTIDLVKEFITDHANPDVYDHSLLTRISQQLLIESEAISSKGNTLL